MARQIVVAVKGGRKRRPVPESPKEAARRKAASERMKNDPRFSMNAGAGNELANNQKGDYEDGVKVRNKHGHNQFTHPRGLKFWSPDEVKKMMDTDAPEEFCEKAGLPFGEKYTLGDCMLWITAREAMLSNDPYRRDKAQEMILKLANVAQVALPGNQQLGASASIVNAPRTVNINFVKAPKQLGSDEKLREGVRALTQPKDAKVIDAT